MSDDKLCFGQYMRFAIHIYGYGAYISVAGINVAIIKGINELRLKGSEIQNHQCVANDHGCNDDQDDQADPFELAEILCPLIAHINVTLRMIYFIILEKISSVKLHFPQKYAIMKRNHPFD